MEYAALWPLAGFFGWLWIMCRNNMVRSFGGGVLAAAMIFPACVAGPFTWAVAAFTEYDGRIR